MRSQVVTASNTFLARRHRFTKPQELMNARSLLLIVLKIVGLFFLRDFITSLPSFLSVISMSLNFSGGGYLSSFVAVLLVVALYGYLAYLLLFKTERIFALLDLGRGIDERIELNIHRMTVLQLAVIVTGCLLALTALPGLLRHAFLYFQYLGNRGNVLNIYPKPDNTLMIVLTAELIIGLLLVSNHRKAAAYIDKKRRDG